MADHKNQHFVPRVLLRPFTKDAEDKSINLYNIRADRLIQDAPVKGQCARHYYYGEDGQLEKILGRLEGMFGNTRARVIAGSNAERDKDEVNLFMCFQHYRTARFTASYRHSIEQANAETWGPDKDAIPEDKKLVISAMRFAIKSRPFLTDLKMRFIENHSNQDFIIGDDPAVMLNRYAYERLGRSAFGMASSGLIFVMPMSPRSAVICYDSLVYSANVTNGRMIIKNETAIDAYNDIQCIAADENIYFQKWEDGEYVRQRFAEVKHKRRPHSIAQTFVPDGETEDAEHYRPGTIEEGQAAKRSLIAVQFNYPEPDRWIPGLRYRPKPVTFYNGSGVGHVRKPERLHRGPDDPPEQTDGRDKKHIVRMKPRAD